MSRNLVVYTYANCDTCRRAVKWLRSRGIEFTEKAIRETPPSLAELKRMFDFQGGDLRRLFNVSGRDYREQELGKKLPSLSTTEAFALLAGNGNLVKRPFALGSHVGLVGFDESVWSAAFEA